ncbi:ParA family protein [Streptomyces antimycoticus]|uniref:ParA family protein n=1 Tax=Streptomyces antimycoticus TaxID=68175 RepID=UPI00117E9586|nr:ParA family protein [Streptomyces antimycoticus]
MARSDVTVPNQQQPPPPGPEDDEGDVTVMACLKGGSTKTTTTNYLAFVRAIRRKRRAGKGKNLPVKVLDADTVSQTTYRWAKKFKEAEARRAEARNEQAQPYPLDVERYPFEDLDEYIAELRSEGHDVYADIGGGNVQLFHKSLRHADRLLVPLSPSEFDFDRVDPTFSEASTVYDEHARDGFETYVLLSRKISDKQSRECRDELAKLRFRDEPLAVLDTEVEQLIEYTRQLGKIPQNLDEYTDVWDEIMRREAAKRAALTEVAG